MAETVSLYLSYTESSGDPLKSFDGNVAVADDTTNLLNGKAKNRSVSSLPHHSPVHWIEILFSLYPNKQAISAKMDQKPLGRETKKARSVASGHSFERGEYSGTHQSSQMSTETAKEANAVGGVDYLVESARRSLQTQQQGSSDGKVGTGDQIELEVLIKRAFRLSLTDGSEFTRLTVAETQYIDKGKEPIRPAVTETSSVVTTISQNSKNTAWSYINKKTPLRSALKKKLISSTRLSTKRQSPTRSRESDQLTAKTTIQFESCEAGPIGLQKSDNKSIETDDGWKEDCNGSDEHDSEDDISDEEDQELQHRLDLILRNSPASAITVKPYTSLMTGDDVFLFSHGIIIPRKDVNKLAYGVAIPGKIFRQKKNRYPSTFAFLVALAKANLDILDIGTANTDLIRTLILDDAEEAYRKSRYGDYTWVGTTKERKHRYDPDTRFWWSIFYPSQWRRHGLVLPEGQNVSLEHVFDFRC